MRWMIGNSCLAIYSVSHLNLFGATVSSFRSFRMYTVRKFTKIGLNQIDFGATRASRPLQSNPFAVFDVRMRQIYLRCFPHERIIHLFNSIYVISIFIYFYCNQLESVDVRIIQNWFFNDPFPRRQFSTWHCHLLNIHRRHCRLPNDSTMNNLRCDWTFFCGYQLSSVVTQRQRRTTWYIFATRSNRFCRMRMNILFGRSNPDFNCQLTQLTQSRFNSEITKQTNCQESICVLVVCTAMCRCSFHFSKAKIYDSQWLAEMSNGFKQKLDRNLETNLTFERHLHQQQPECVWADCDFIIARI